MLNTSHDRLSFMRVGRFLPSVYFPSLRQSLMAWPRMSGQILFIISLATTRSLDIRLCFSVPFLLSLMPYTTRLDLRSLGLTEDFEAGPAVAVLALLIAGRCTAPA